MSVQSMSFARRYSIFAPDFTYRVTDETSGWWLGDVAHFAGKPWYASNKTWTGGGDLVNTFPTRHAAADALWHLAHGTANPSTYGGYTS